MLKLSNLVCLTAVFFLVELSAGDEVKLTVNLVKAIGKTQPHSRGTTSPLAAELLVAVTAQGAKGQTEAELRKVANLPDKERTKTLAKTVIPLLKKPNGKFRVVLSNKIYIDQKFQVKEKFKSVAKSYFNTEVENVNFADTTKTVEVINDWVTKRSNNKVHNVIRANQVNKNTKMVLVSNVWMKGKWEIPFPPSKTTKNTFHFASLLNRKITMMNSVGSYRFKHCGYLKAKFLEIPFKNSSVSTTFILPDAQQGLEDIENNVELYLKTHDLKRQRVEVSLPKFASNIPHDYKQLLGQLGVKKVFNAAEADLSGISMKKGLSIDVFQQKIFINITESGIGTGVVKSDEAAETKKPPKQTFNADHPFFYYIKDTKSDAILLVGHFK